MTQCTGGANINYMEGKTTNKGSSYPIKYNLNTVQNTEKPSSGREHTVSQSYNLFSPGLVISLLNELDLNSK